MMNKRTLKDWVFAARPWALPASMMPVLITMAYWYGTSDNIDWLGGWICLLGVILVHTSGNLISDYHDFRRGVDRTETYGTKMLTSGQFTPREILTFGWVTLILGAVVGVYLASRSDVTLLWIEAFGLISALFYYYFKYRSLGDLLIFLSFGYLIVLGTTFVLIGSWQFETILLALPVAFLTVAILHANNTRDIVDDRQANIITLAMRLGVKGSILYYRLLLIAAYTTVFILACVGLFSGWSFLCFLSLPLAYKNCILIGRAKEGATAISNMDELTAKLQMAFGLSLSLGLLLSHYL